MVSSTAHLPALERDVAGDYPATERLERLSEQTPQNDARAHVKPASHLEVSESLKPERDHRLDFWRGLCLIDMLLVHLIHQGMKLGQGIDLWVGEYLRFAAGGFVFIAGLSVGAIFLPRARDPQKRWATYRALWKRAAFILAVHFVAEIGFLIMWPLFGGVPFKHIASPIWTILTLYGGYDLLPFYVVMVALAPAMLELLRRGLWWVLAAASVAVFAGAQLTGAWYTYALPIQHDFYPVLWQVIFVGGMIGGAFLPKYDRLSRRTKVIVAASLWAAQLCLFLAYYGPNFGVYFWLPLTFSKVPLTTGEALRYLTLMLAIMATTDLLWRSVFAGGALARFSERLGRNSLAVYVFHVWMVQAVVRLADWVGSLWLRIALAAVAVAGLWAFALLLEFGGSKRKKNRAKAAAAVDGDTNGTPQQPHAQVKRESAPRSLWRLPLTIGQRPIGGLPVLAVLTLVVLVAVNYGQSTITRRYMLNRQAVPSPAGDLLKDRHDQTFAEDFIPDPNDDPVTDPDEDDDWDIPVIPRENPFEGLEWPPELRIN